MSAATKVTPFNVSDAELIRYMGWYFTPDEIPVQFSQVPFGCFEFKLNGTWRKARGSYASPDGPMVWLEENK